MVDWKTIAEVERVVLNALFEGRFAVNATSAGVVSPR
jgi:hypothetical protein